MNPAWQLLRLASPQLPIGGYSYSQGLEMAVDSSLVHDPDSARRWIADQLLLNLARFEAPLLLAHCRAAAVADWGRLADLAERHRASRESRELALESRQMGYSLKQLLEGLPELDEAPEPFCTRSRSSVWRPPGRWLRAPGTSAPRMPWPPGCGAGWKTSWRC